MNLATAFIDFMATGEQETGASIDRMGDKLNKLPTQLNLGKLITGAMEGVTRGTGSLDGIFEHMKHHLVEITKGAKGIDISKGIGSGLRGAFASFGKEASLVGDAISHSIGIGSKMGLMAGLTEGASTVLPLLGPLLFNPITGIIAGALALAIASLPAGIERETKITRLSLSMGGNKEKARDLAEFGERTFAGTGIGNEEYEHVAQKMVGRGNDPEEVKRQLKAIGNIAVGTGESFGGMAHAMERMEMSGKVTHYTLRQMEPVVEAMANKMGVSAQKVYEMAEKGKISYADLKNTIEELGGEGGKFGNAMKTMQQTTAGAWSRLTTEIGGFFADIGEQINASFDLGGMLSNLADMVSLVREIMGAINDIIPVAKMLHYIFHEIHETFKDIIVVVKYLAEKEREAAKYLPWNWGTDTEDKTRKTPENSGRNTNKDYQFMSMTSLAEHLQQRASDDRQITMLNEQLQVQKSMDKSLSTIAGESASKAVSTAAWMMMFF